jgi:hypothetical protein
VSRVSIASLLVKWARQRFDRIDRRHNEIIQAISIYGDTIMAQNDELNAALTKLEQAVADVLGRVPEPMDLTPAIDRINAVTAKVNAIAAAPANPS